MPAQTAKTPEFIDGFPFMGGALWIDVLNTVMGVAPSQRDLIDTADREKAWLAAAGESRQMALPAVTRPSMRALREELRPAVDLFRSRQKLPAALIARINHLLSNVSTRPSLEAVKDGFRLTERFDAGEAGLDGAIAVDFARFVCEAEPERLKHCTNPACSMVFYDTSKNGTRRWCTMTICGNRDKIARFRQRKSGKSR